MSCFQHVSCRAATPWFFKRGPEPKLSYSFNSHRFSIEDYLGRNPTMGLLIAKNDTILYEHFAVMFRRPHLLQAHPFLLPA